MKMINRENDTVKKLTAGVAIFMILCVCFCVTSFALVYAVVSVENNVFTTGFVDINLNDEQPVISSPELYFAPGMMVEKEFFIENKSPRDVYYILYFDAVSGGLSELLQITIFDGEAILFQGTPASLTRDKVKTAQVPILLAKEKKDLKISFYLDDGEGNDLKTAALNFNLCAEAVQVANNPNREFND